MAKTTIVQIPTGRYSLEHSAALWRKTTTYRWYAVAPKEVPPKRGWKQSMKEAVRVHRKRRAR